MREESLEGSPTKQGALARVLGHRSRVWRAGLSVLTAGAIVATVLSPSISFADQSADAEEGELTAKQLLTKMGEKKADVAKGDLGTQLDEFDPNEKVTVVVQLEGGASGPLNPFATLFGIRATTDHDAMRSRIQSLVDSSVDSGEIQLFDNDGAESPADATIEQVADYYNVIDGFAIKAPRGIVDQIAELQGVKNAFVEQIYKVPEDQGKQSSVKNASSLSMTGADKVEYRGAGQTIAIVDSGLQTNHEAFSGKLPEGSAAWSQEAVSSAAASLNQGKAGKYLSEKIPFVYDYADNDDEVTPRQYTDLSHGTHVAGIAAGNGGKIEGTAPDAQIMMFKVCDDLQGNIYDSVLLSALDDIAALDSAGTANIDVVNMSIGSDNGFAEGASSQTYSDAVDKLQDGGITVNVAAGNAYDAAYGNNSGQNLPYASDPDAEIVSSPASFDSSLAVASVNNAEGGDGFAWGTEIIAYQNMTAQDGSSQPAFSSLADGTYALVDGGLGTSRDAQAASDANGATLKGKIVLIKRGPDPDGNQLTFQAKAEAFRDLAPAAVVFYDNVQETSTNFGLSSALEFPCAGISLDSGSKLVAALADDDDSNDSIVIKAGTKAADSDFSSYTMSSFSSWGTTPEMGIKPEITAPGGNIYSAVAGSSNAYDYMSGTSMATPQMAGISAQVKQYIASDAKFAGLTDEQRNDMVTQLLMSTARPIDAPDDASYYSPRKQGSGLADVGAATATPVYLTVEDAASESRPKADLGESDSGSWSFSVTLHNLSDDEVSYTPDTHAISDTVSKDNLFQQESKDWTGAGIDVSYGGDAYDSETDTVKVASRSSATYSITVSCQDTFKDWASKNTPNGTFVEGFAKLVGASEGAVDLSVPFCGFYGDWDTVPVFDASYESEKAHSIGTLIVSGTSGLPLGINPLDSIGTSSNAYAAYMDSNKRVVSSASFSTAPSNVYPYTGLLRNLKNYKVEYKNKDGNTVLSYEKPYQVKSHYNANAGMTWGEQWSGQYSFDGQDQEGNYLPQGDYTLVKTATTAGGDNGTQSEETVFSYDKEGPVISDVEYSGEGDDRAVSFKVTDNTWLSAIQFYDTENQGYFFRQLADDTNGDGSHTKADAEEYVENADGTRTWSFKIKMSDLRSTWNSQAKSAGIEGTMPNVISLYAWDYGLNGSKATRVVATPIAATSIEVSPNELSLYEGQSEQLSITAKPDEATDTDVKWTSSDDEVAAVNADGTVTAGKNGEAKITATLKSNDKVHSSAVIKVTDVPQEVGIAMKDKEVTASYGEQIVLNALRAPEYADDVISWESSNEQVATVSSADDAEGSATGTVVTGQKTGNTTITATLTHDGKTYKASTKVKVRVGDYDDFVIDEDYEGGPRLLYYSGHKSVVDVPDNVEVIGPQAFAGTSPEVVNIPTSVKEIEDQAFYYMPNLKTVNFEDTDENPSQLKKVGDGIFYYTLVLEEVSFPRSLKKMGTGTFSTSAVKKVVLPEGLRSIPASTFYYCSVTDVTISDRVTKIGDNAFGSSSSFATLRLVGTEQGPDSEGNLPTGLPSSLVTIGKSAFAGTSLPEAVLPEGVTTVGDGAFQSCAASRIELNDGLESIGASAFMGCGNVKTFAVPDSVTEVGFGAFQSLSSCKEFTLGRNIGADMLDSGFANCKVLERFIVAEDTVNYAAVDGVLFNKEKTKLISYAEASQDASHFYAVPAGTVTIADYAFYDTMLTNVEFPESLRTIGNSCFTSANLTSLVLPEQFETVDSAAFQNCAQIKSIDLGGTTHIKGYAFYSNVSLTDLNMRADLGRLKIIEQGAFTECSSITELVFPDSVTDIKGMGFINMPRLQKVHIGAGMTGSLSGAFTGDQNLREITVSENNKVYHAKDNVLYGVMGKEQDSEYPGKHLVLSLPTNTFSEYVVEEGTVAIDAQAFRNNTQLKKVTLPEGLRKIDTGGFNSCSNLSDINFPDSLEHVTGFYNCNKLKTVDFGTKIVEIEDNAFMGDLPSHIIVRGGNNGKFTDGMDYTGDEFAETAYFGPGMSEIVWNWTEAPVTLVVPGDVESLKLKSPASARIDSFKVYVPSGTTGEQVVKKALKESGISESHIADYQTLGGSISAGKATGADDSSDAPETKKSYTIGSTWYMTGTNDASSAGTYLGSSVLVTYAGNDRYKVMFSPNSLYTNYIKGMSYEGAELERDGASYSLTVDKEKLSKRLNIAFDINTGSFVSNQNADVELDQAAVANMIADVENSMSGMSKKQIKLLGSEDATDAAGGTLAVGAENWVHVDAHGGVAGERQYRFVETAPDGTQQVLQNWSSERSFKWVPVESGATLSAEVRDATYLTAQVAGVMRALDEQGQQYEKALAELIESAGKIERGDGSAEAFEELQSAIASAREVAANKNVTTDQLGQAIADVQKAIEKLSASAAPQVDPGTDSKPADEDAKSGGNVGSGTRAASGQKVRAAAKSFTVNTKTVTATALKRAAAKQGATVKSTTSIVLGSKVKTVKNSAFKAFKKLKTVTLGKNVKSIKAKAFAGSTVKTVVVKSKKLSSSSVRNIGKAPKLKTVKVAISGAKAKKKLVKLYKSLLVKKNTGKKISVRK